MRKGFFTTIEITNTHLKVLQAKESRGIPSLSSCLIKKLENRSEDYIVKLLADSPSIEKGQDNNAIIIIPRKSVIFRYLLLPSETEHEIRRMISLQIVNQVPYPREDIIFDFSILEKKESGYTNVLVAVVHKQIISRYLKIINKVGFVPHQCVVTSCGIAEWFFTYASREVKGQEATIALVHIDYDFTEICFCKNQKLLFSRSIQVGAKELKEGDEDLMEQVELTFGAYNKEKMGGDISKIIILSKTPEAVTLAEKLKEYYKLPVGNVAVMDSLISDKSLDALSLKEAEEGASVLPAMGFLSTEGKPSINLIPPELLDTRKSKIKRRAFMRFSIMLVVTIFLGAGAFSMSIHQDSRKLAVIEEEISQTESAVKLAQEDTQFLKFIDEELQSRVLIADVIKELYAITPEKISFLSWAIGRQRTLTIQGFADTGSDVNDFQGGLVDSSLFRDVTLEYATKRRRFRAEYTDFKITCKLSIGENITQ